MTAFTSGKFGNGLAFDGINDVLGLPAYSMPSVSILKNFSISLWFYAQDNVSLQTLVNQYSNAGDRIGVQVYNGMIKAGFDIIDGDSAIVPVMLYDAKLSQKMANELLIKGIYVVGFFFPVVPKDKARIRVQLSAAHTKAHLNKAIQAFTEVGKALNIIN